MHRGHRLVAGLATFIVVPTVLAVPVLTGPQAEIRPVSPVVTQLALDGIDPVALRASSAPVPESDPAVDDSALPDPGPTAADAVPTSSPALPKPAPVAGPTRPLAPAVVTAATSTKPFSLVGVDWKGATVPGTSVQVRVRENGTWGAWSELHVDASHGPDPGSEEALAADVRQGTEPLMTAPGSDGVQVRIDTPGGVVPTDAKVTLIDPQTSTADAVVAPTPVSSSAAAGDPLRPAIISRAQWGADESLRDRAPIYTGPVKVGFIHHTASTTNYTAAQATAQVRALYAYFTLGLHYSDIAYNFLIDRYGRLYEGRAGGTAANVLGGHTAGFNQNTFAVSALGNFDTYKPTTAEANAIVTNISRLMAWKLAINHRDPLGSATLISNSSAGTSKYGVGQAATVPVVLGHRDIGSTACPGRYLEPFVPRIRTLARQYMRTQILKPVLAPSVTSYGGTGTTIAATTTTPVTWRLEVFSVCQDTPVRVLTGRQVTAGALSVAWNQKRADGTAALPGTYRLVLSASTGAAVAYPVELGYVVSETSTSPMGPCAQAARIGETERYSAAVHAGRVAAPSARTVVLAPGEDTGLPEALLAAPLAVVKAAPRLLTTAAGLPASVRTDIAARKATTAYLVGSTTQISVAVETQLKGLGVTTIVRLTGADRAATAAAVADAMGIRGRAVVVTFDAGYSLDAVAVAAADAAAARRPLLVVSRGAVPAATSAAIARLGVSAPVVVASPTVVTDAVVTALGATRVNGVDDVRTSSQLAKLLAPTASRVTVAPTAAGWVRVIAAGAGRPLLLGSGGTAGLAGWLRTAAATHVLGVASRATWSDAALGELAQSIAARSGAPAPSPSPTPVPTTPPVAPSATVAIPASFTFNGSGYGHGVGMSQWGAYGMAVEGRTAQQIVQHYYTGTTVTPVRDDMDIRVNLLHLRTSLVLRSEAVASGGGRIEVTVAGVAPFLGTTADVFTIRAAGSGRTTVLRTRAGVTTTLGTGTLVTVRWAGTRTPGTAGTVATLVNVATTSSGFASAGHRYRYGVIDIASTTASPGTVEVVNSVRVHDEYLRGIAEVSSSWPAAALQAQVLAARTYAVSRYGTGVVRSACRCHVDDGGGPYYDQTFAGYTKETSAGGAYWRAAVLASQVTATTGKAILAAGKPITAFYFSASGGATQNSQDVWVSPLSYATSVDDHWSLSATVPWSTWKPRVYTQAQVATAFGLPNVVRLDLSSRTAGGGVKTAVAYSSTGSSASLRGETLRTKLTLPSTWVSRAVASAAGDPATLAVKAAASSTSKTVVLAATESPAMVAVAANLAAQKGWPLLLTTKAALTSVTRAELVRRNPTLVYAVGTAAQLPATIVTAANAVSGTVTRVTGATDSDVSIATATLLGRPSGTHAIVVSATDATSAAVASGAAATLKRPLLVVPAGAAGSAAVTAYLTRQAAPTAVVIGPATAVADSVLLTLPKGWRLAGADAVETSAKVATYLGITRTARTSLMAASGSVVAMAMAPGAPVLVVGTALARVHEAGAAEGRHHPRGGTRRLGCDPAGRSPRLIPDPLQCNGSQPLP